MINKLNGNFAEFLLYVTSEDMS